MFSACSSLLTSPLVFSASVALLFILLVPLLIAFVIMNLLRHLPRSVTPTWLAIRSYYTNRVKRATLYSKISPLGGSRTGVVAELDNWVGHGNKVRVGELQRIIHDLRRRKRFGQALQVSEWMNTKGICVFSASEHAVHLDLTGKVHGFVSAEKYFSSLKEQHKTHQTYGALLNCYVRQKQVDKVLSHFQEMKRNGFNSSPLMYNDIMCLYTNTGQHWKVPNVLSEMKENGVAPDNYGYRICINAYGVGSDLEGIEKTLQEMASQTHIAIDWNTYAVAADYYIKAGMSDRAVELLLKSEERLETKDGSGYNFLISMYARLGNKSEVLRLWDLEKAACKRRINRDYITMLQSLMRLNELEEAQKVLKDWESSGNCYDFRVPSIVILGYCEKGLVEESEAILRYLVEKGRITAPSSWMRVAAGYARAGWLEKAFACVEAGFSLCAENKRSKPDVKAIRRILEWLSDEGRFEEVKAFVDSLRRFIPVNRDMYHALMKAGLRCGREVDSVLKCMKADNIDQNEETRRMLGMKLN